MNPGYSRNLPGRATKDHLEARRMSTLIPGREAESAPYQAPRDRLDSRFCPSFEECLARRQAPFGTRKRPPFLRSSGGVPTVTRSLRKTSVGFSRIHSASPSRIPTTGSFALASSGSEKPTEKFSGTTCSPADHCLSSRPPLPRWRNWQTRQVQVLVGVISRGGSSPFLGIFKPESERTLRNSAEF